MAAAPGMKVQPRRRPRLTFRFCDESDFGFGWITDERLPRTSHALAVDGRVWLVDPLLWREGLERVRSSGEPAGVIQLLDRHNRDCAAIDFELTRPACRCCDVVNTETRSTPLALPKIAVPRSHPAT